MWKWEPPATALVEKFFWKFISELFNEGFIYFFFSFIQKKIINKENVLLTFVYRVIKSAQNQAAKESDKKCGIDIYIYIYIYPNNTRDVYLYIYSVSAYMG